MKFGIYRLDGISTEKLLRRAERELGVPIRFRSYYRAWNRCLIDDDRSWFNTLASSRRDVLLTWEPWFVPPALLHPEEQPQFSLQEILSGRYDAYAREVARLLASLPITVYLRPMHEMNGNWYPWCGTVNGNTCSDYIQVWHHLRRLFCEEHPANIRWVWSPYVFSFPDASVNQIERFFPGDDAVDYIGLDGYNWGNETEWGRWQSFNDLFAEAYDRVTRLSAKPVLICETASASGGGDKSQWIGEMLEELSSGYKRVEALVWFDVDKECDWRISCSQAVLEVFRSKAPCVFG